MKDVFRRAGDEISDTDMSFVKEGKA